MEQSTQGVMESQTANQQPVGEGIPIPTPPQTPTVAFTKVDNNLTGIGFFTASSKRSRKAIEKTTVVMDQGVEHRISILPSAKYGLPITQDQDYWLALMKLVTEHVQREGKLTNPFTFTTAQLQHILGQSDAGKNYKAVEEWLAVMVSTTIEGGAYNTAQKQWMTKRTHAVETTVTVGKELPDGGVADKNHIWFSQWQLDNINAGNLIPIEIATYRQLQNNIAKNLVPHLQEWLYASQRDGRFEKQYEDICQLLGIRVYQYLSDIERKFGPSLNELLAHGYISKWAIEHMADRTTYKLVIWHGQKYHRDQQHRMDRKPRAQLSSAASENTTQVHRPRQRRLNLRAAAPEPEDQQRSSPVIDYRIVAELTKRGISETDARTILVSLPADQVVLDQLEWGDFQIAQGRGKITNPPGFYISLLQRGVIPPPTFETSATRTARQQAEFERQQALQQETDAQLAADAAAEAALDQLQATDPERYQALYSKVQTELITDRPKIGDFLRSHPGSNLHDGAIRARIRQLLKTSEVIPATVPEGVKQQPENAPSPQGGLLKENPLPGEVLFAAILKTVLMTVYLPAPKEPTPAQNSPESTP